MAEFPALPLYTDAYIGDTQHLTNEEHGVYLRLLMFAWRTADCSLPDDDKRLALMVGVTAKKWASLKPVVMSFWALVEGRWKQKRLTAQREFVERSREQKRAAGTASSKAKALKNNTPAATAVVQPLLAAGVTELPTERQQPISIPIEEDKSSSYLPETSSGAKAKRARNEAYSAEFETFWAAYPRKIEKQDALKAFLKARAKVSLETIMAGVKTFAAEKAGTDPAFIRHASKWLNAASWENGTEIRATVAPVVDDTQWEKRLGFGRNREKWDTAKWGPPPGQDGCLVPEHLLKPGDGNGWRGWELAA